MRLVLRLEMGDGQPDLGVVHMDISHMSVAQALEAMSRSISDFAVPNSGRTPSIYDVGLQPVATPTRFKLVMMRGPDSGTGQRINAIKEVRTITRLGLKEAKDMVEEAAPNSPKTVALGLSRDIAHGFAATFISFGCWMEVLPDMSAAPEPTPATPSAGRALQL